MIKIDHQLQSFRDLLYDYNKTHNITGAKNKEQIEQNIQDSIAPLGFLDPFESCVDIGTGAGFPGLALAICAPKSRFYLVEPLKKRYAFLNLAKVSLRLDNVTICPQRVEKLTLETPIDLITSRAVTKTAVILDIVQHLISQKTQMLLYKGESVASELDGHLQNYDIIPRENKGNYLYIKGIL
jgi:16S rRNA (guanine527-N7)-methyltransferase